MNLSRMPKEGDKFGNWIIERTLDKGGMGMVYLACNPDLGRSEKVALKVLDPAVVERDADFVKRFYQEAAIVFKTHCPNLVSIHDAGRDAASGFYYIVMEYLGGGTLRERMRRQGQMPWREALAIIRSVAQALSAVAKRNSVHRDIKPENIMFTVDGVVKLADFGIAKTMQDDVSENASPLKTRALQVFGTPAYMSPEQMSDASTVDARADIWSLGVVLFEMLAGTRPYPAKDLLQAGAFLLSPKPFPDIRTFRMPTGTSPDIPDGVAKLLLRMCDKDLSKRIAASEDVVHAVDLLLNGRKEQKHAVLGVVGAASVLALLAFGAFVLLKPNDMPEPIPPPPVEANPPPVVSAPALPPPQEPPVRDIGLFQPQGGTVEAVLAQLDAAIIRKPAHLRVSLSPYAQNRDLSIERYEMKLLVPAVERLRSSGVNYSLVPGAGKYGSSVRDVAKRFGCEVE